MDTDGSDETFVTAGVEPDWQPIPINAYPRPAGASPLRVSLVTAYDECTAPNRTHGPPLGFDSCNPPTRTSDHLTVGTADSNGQVVRYEGHVRLNTIVGNPSTPGDQADVAIDFFSKGALTNALAHYTGELRAEVPLQITDKDNTPHPGGPGAATTQDFTFDVDATCAIVPDPSPHSECHTTTTADALIPGSIKEGRRSIWQLGQVVVYDGGPDGDTATRPATRCSPGRASSSRSRRVRLGSARAPRGRDDPPPARSARGGTDDRARAGARPAVVQARCAARRRARADRPAHRGSAAPRQVPDRRPRRRPSPGHAPADDREPAVGVARRGPRAAAAPERAAHPRRRPPPAVRRPAPVRHRRRDRGDRPARRVPRPAGRPGAARPGVHARRPRPRRPRAPCSGESVPARPAPRGRRREHLRRRGPVPRGHPSAPPGRPPAPRRDRAPARGHRRDPRARDRPAGRLDRRLPGLQRRARLDAGRVPDPSACGSAVHPLRPPGDEDGRRRAGDVRVPPLPAGPATAPAAHRPR